MKRRLPITVLSTAVISLGSINLFSCAKNDSAKPVELTPITRHKKPMNPNVPNITVGNFRLQILDDSTVRFEYKYNNPIFHTYDWLDDDTLFVPNRTDYEGLQNYTVTRDNTLTTVVFNDIKIVIPNNIKADLLGITVYRHIDGKDTLIYESTDHTDNTGELPKPNDTKDAFEFIDYPRIIEPPFGYSESNLYVEPYCSHLKYFKNTCGFEIQKHRDIYLTFPRGNARALRQQYRNLAGASELVRLSTLGAWDSRYYPYNETTAQEEVDHYNENKLPLDNLVIDTDWRAGFDGKGYFVNETLFPNMPRFLKSIHDQNIEVCFNDHPEPQKEGGMELDVLNPTEVQFRRSNLQKIMGMGLDTWWYDRNWSTSLICPTGTTEADLNHEVWGDYLYNNATRQEYMLQASEKYEDYGQYVYKRPIAMSNVVQIRNGKWEGFTDSAAHRYSIQWTGDQNSTMLNTEVQNVVKTGINSMPYMSSDLAGHTNPIASDYYYQRWMEYGALSPIFRIHCTRDLPRHCQPWLWSDQALNTFRNWINLRYRLLPLYYSLARESYETGMPICRALTFDYPNTPQTEDNFDESEYLLGNNILFAPCVEKDEAHISPSFTGQWSNLTATFYKTEDLSGEPSEPVPYPSIDEDDMAGKGMQIIDQSEHFSVRFNGTFTPSETKKLSFNSDDGVKVMVYDPDQDRWVSASDWTAHGPQDFLTGIQLEQGKSYPMVVDYLQDSGEGSIHMQGYEEEQKVEEVKKVYLPEGQWYDVFHGNTYIGDRTYYISYPTAQNAVFARIGSMTPLINNARNTKELDWTKLTYDVYPTKSSAFDSSTLYEDDFESVAYQLGYYHKSHYGCYYDRDTKEFVVRLDPSVGWYIGDDQISERQYTIRLHALDGLNFGAMTLDGKPITVQPTHPSEDVQMPFVFAGPGMAGTEDVFEIVIPKDSIRAGHELRVKLS